MAVDTVFEDSFADFRMCRRWLNFVARETMFGHGLEPGFLLMHIVTG
jgi:hypothetical protein